MDDSINPHIRAPEAKVNLSTRDKFLKVQLPPAMQPEPAEQTLHSIGLMLPVRPKFFRQ